VTGPVDEVPAAAPARGPVDRALGEGDWPVVEPSAGDTTDRATAGDDAEPDRQPPE
jgi:hypothetical protein